MRYTQPQSGPHQIATEWCGLGLNSLYMSIGTTPVDLTGNYKTALTGTMPTIAVGRGGIGASFNGSTQYLHTPVRALSFGTAFSKFALIVLNSVSTSQTISCTAASTGAQFRINSGNLELLHSATAVVLSAPHGLSIGQLACVGVTYDSTTVRLFVNGRQIGSVACSINFTELSVDTYIGRRDGGVEQFNGMIFVHADFSRAASIQAAKDLTTNIWQLFCDRSEEDLFLFMTAAASGPASYSYSASGGLALSGLAARVRGTSRTAAGGAQLGGAATVRRGAVRTSSSGLTLSGAATLTRRMAKAAAGGIQFAGAAALSVSQVVQSLVVGAVGGLVLRGAAGVVRKAGKVASGGIRFAGRAAMSTGPLGQLLGNLLPTLRRRRRR